ncbi:MAG: hypothetical protein JXB32_23290 [Deltaproteobacteria bacterium]|nr:hypothetical protein [Deltaproteobacteria bacterium]
MPRPLAICLEDLEPGAGRPRYLRCVAVVGREPGLRLDGAGAVLWKSDEASACELWVSQDDKLILYRAAGGAEVTVRREGRSLAVPEQKPVVLLDQDRFEVGSRRLRVHVHGAIDHACAPSPLPEPASTGRARAAVAVAALGATLGAADCKKPEPSGDVEVRATPPAVSWDDAAGPATPDATGLPSPDVVDASSIGPDGDPIEVRVAPPAVMLVPEEIAPTAPDAGAPADPQPDAGTSAPDAAPPPDAAPIEVRVAPPSMPRPVDAGVVEPPTGDAGKDVRPQRDRTPPIEVRTRPPAPPIEARQRDPDPGRDE